MDLVSLSVRSVGLTETLQVQEISAREATETRQDCDIANKRETRARLTGDEELPVISLDEVAWHDTADDCWLVIYDYVYDCTSFLDLHPGGRDVLLEYAGRDATIAFIGTGHSKAARLGLREYLIGELPAEERMFRTPHGVKIADF